MRGCGVFAAYVTPDGGRALIDRELYLPQKWTDDRDRCRAAGIGDDAAFGTKPELGRKVIERAVRQECQGRGRAGPLPGPQVPGLVPARHPGHARARLPRRHRPRLTPRCLTAAEARRLFNLHTQVDRPVEFHRQWSHRRPALHFASLTTTFPSCIAGDHSLVCLYRLILVTGYAKIRAAVTGHAK